MYVISMQIHGPVSTEIYTQLAETYKLPTLAMLVTSLDHTIAWRCDEATQVYFLDNLREPNRRNLFQVRFPPRQKGTEKPHDLISLFVSVEPDNQTLHMLTVRFPARGNRKTSAHIIGWLKSMARQNPEFDFEIEGYAEGQRFRFIREHSLSAFQWNEREQRYFHVTEQTP